MLLYCVRHGSTEWTDEGRYSGRSNPVLSYQGIRESQEIAGALTGQSFDAVYCSPLTRCQQTLAEIGKQLNLQNIATEPNLAEIDYGAWEGKTRAEIAAQDPDAFRFWDTDPTRQAPPRGESVADVAARLDAFQNLLFGQSQASVLVIAHRTVLRLLVAKVLEIPLANYRERLDHDPAALTVIDLKKPNHGKLLLYNYHPGNRHLNGR